MLISIVAVLLIVTALYFSFREKTTIQNNGKKVTFDLSLQQEEFESKFNRLLFEQKTYMTLIVNFENYFVQYLFDNKVSDFGVYCESIGEEYFNKNTLENKPSIDELLKLDFSLSQEFMETKNYNKLYQVNSSNERKLILKELYLIMNKVYHVTKSTPVTLHYF